MIDFENQLNSRRNNMETIKTEFDLTVEQSAESLWEEFERTGSVKTYLLYVQKAKSNEELETAGLSSLT